MGVIFSTHLDKLIMKVTSTYDISYSNFIQFQKKTQNLKLLHKYLPVLFEKFMNSSKTSWKHLHLNTREFSCAMHESILDTYKKHKKSEILK